MPVPATVLDQPIQWSDPSLWPLLNDLQGNILKGHGRDHTMNHFLRFGPGDLAAAKVIVRALGARTTSALRQLQEVEDFKLFERPGGTGVFFFLTRTGFQRLGLQPPAGAAFAGGMASRQLGDPATAAWEAHLRPGIDAMLLVADDSVTKVGNAAAALTRGFAAAGIQVVGVDAGHALRSDPSVNEPKGRGIEHFGYVDGRSQPLMLSQDVAREQNESDGIDVWDPRVGPGKSVLVRDPNGKSDDSYGSFLVYRKLEQNVAGFKHRENALADALSLVGEDRERAGAMVVGRFEDGTPLILESEAKDPNPTPNNFDYASDAPGDRCPIHAHIRKINPRTPNDAEQRTHLMARRGIPFGDPDRDLEDEASFPTGGVGLLFMAYNQDIERQFEVTQRFWANDDAFPGDAQGRDAIIGQPVGGGADSKWPTGKPAPNDRVTFGFRDFVTMKGGEYFFAPSRSALIGLT
ncbi:MAG: Dyp-type peroxidase [Alphaproteobacteria bacterium]|nr:Dyp-type peroxidase [Alphaproteobacteria bacterium]MBU1515090.1 Dyp-type peroxidase [Alphaproteobacteria bacterium]MBU2093448.1 Dyp-type peroxidase [Alphaproteobacteria bacterium]MBU2152296.1 Dyp-type peroxidase [Alphaproteobacteria bacterium]MBU2308110.1 Dyp-type peroxidase [Alphaproteobacteria bacterium]